MAPRLAARMGTMSSVVGDPATGDGRCRGLVEQPTFEHYVGGVRAQVDARLAWWLDARVAEARARGADIAAVAEALRQLVLRGGKRMRAALLAAAYEGCKGQGGAEAVAPAGAALELLQAYLLAHDDWMDGDDLRRGGPSVPAMMRARFGAQDGAFPATGNGQNLTDAASVLAGNFAAAWALESLLELPIAPAHVVLAARELGRVEEDVVHGQLLDVCARATDACDVEAAYALKTASYTVRCPIIMGARLAGADDAQVAALAAFAKPLGIAFQLRDDVLGTFGDSHAMGKPLGSDLRKGKRTALVVAAMRDPRARESLGRVLGRAQATDDEMATAVARIQECGARAHVEERIAALVREARAALDRTHLTPYALMLLAQAVVVLSERDR
jgi:geranylgeranyl diphosphate synthase type I